MAKSVIWKFPVKVEGEPDGYFEIPLPHDAEPLCFNYDGNGELCLWAVIPDATQTKIMHRHRFRAVATGQEFDKEGEYFGTVMQEPAFGLFPALVFHIYQLPGYGK